VTFTRERVLELLDVLVGTDRAPAAIYFEHAGVPVPKERARRASRSRTGFEQITGAAPKGRFYTPRKTKNAEQDLAWVMRQHVPMTLHGPIALVVVFFLPDRRKVDGDNLVKLVKDAGNTAKIWLDDSQVCDLVVRKRVDAAHPRTLIALAPIPAEPETR
jgi:Holliday junction resolvase RusA-like endonuclease